MSKRRVLSKSKLMAYRQCPKRLWLEVHAPDKQEVSQATERVFRVGHDVGDRARQLYDPQGRGVLVDWGEESFAGAIERSAQLMEQAEDGRPVFEAALSNGRAFALADVMLPLDNGGWKMIEVKSAAGVKDYHRDDVAIQTHIADTAGVDVRQAVLAHVDSSWVYPGDGRYQGLFKEADLSKEARERGGEVKEWIREGHNIIARESPPEIETGTHCHAPYPCAFYGHCSKDEDEGEAAEFPVEWLPRIQKKKLKQFIIDKNVEDMSEVPDDLLNKRQKRVKRCTIKGDVYADYDGARYSLGAPRFPLYFLDFESIQFAVPEWAGTSPYQNVAFQYSLHILDEKGGLQHRDFLSLSGDDPSRAIAEALVRDFGTGPAGGSAGPVFAYYASFEKKRIKELASRFKDLAPALLSINKRIVDLLPVMRNHYYHPDMHGSFSLKSVLPAIAPDLNYAELEGVQHGGMAMDAYAEAIHPDTSPARKQELERQLRKYCALDTLALVRLWQFWYKP